MEEKIIKIKNKIMLLIERNEESYKITGERNEYLLDRIDGLCEALEILEDKEYYWTSEGLFERVHCND